MYDLNVFLLRLWYFYFIAKVRRLYDIANILTSIEFLEKCSTKDDPTRKASYKWIGVDPESLDSKEGTNQCNFSNAAKARSQSTLKLSDKMQNCFYVINLNVVLGFPDVVRWCWSSPVEKVLKLACLKDSNNLRHVRYFFIEFFWNPKSSCFKDHFYMVYSTRFFYRYSYSHLLCCSKKNWNIPWKLFMVGSFYVNGLRHGCFPGDYSRYWEELFSMALRNSSCCCYKVSIFKVVCPCWRTQFEVKGFAIVFSNTEVKWFLKSSHWRSDQRIS